MIGGMLNMLFLKILFLCTLYLRALLKTKDEPKNAQTQKSTFIKIAISFPPLIPCLIPPTDDREKSDRTPTQLPTTKKCNFLRLRPNKVVLIPKKS